MTQEEIAGADLLFKYSSTQHPTQWDKVNQAMRDMGYGVVHAENAAKFLLEAGYLHTFHGEIRLTTKGLQFQRSEKSYGDLLAEEAEKKAKQREKEEIEVQRTILQMQELEIKVKTLEDMQERQKAFWESGMERDRRSKWQFWLTLMLSGAAFILGVINYLKDMIIP